MPFFSVVIPLYNKEKHIKGTIQSVLNQSFGDFEIIIVNDGSTDNSATIVDSIQDKRILFFSTQNKGVSHARNYGIKKSNSKFVALLDGDDQWHKMFLEKIYSAIQLFPAHSVFSTAIALKYPNKTSPAKYKFNNQIKEIMLLDYFKNSLKHTILTSSSIVFKKEIINSIGLFDTNILSGEDTDMWIRIGIKYPVVFINKVLVYYIYDNQSLSNTSFNIYSKPTFDKFLIEEKTNYALKKLLDRNRFSLAIHSKLNNNTERYKFFTKSLNLNNLKYSQKILLFCPTWALNTLLLIKSLKGEKIYYKPLKDKNSL